MDEPRAYYTEWSKSEKEKQILYSNTYIWNPERWYWWTYLQSSSGDIDIKNGLMDMTGGRKERVEGIEWVTWKHTLQYVKYSIEFCFMTLETKTGVQWQPTGVGWGERWKRYSSGRGHG